MVHVYVWRPSHEDPIAAEARFRSVLASRCVLQTETFGRPYQSRHARVGDVLIGQIGTDDGISGWEPWWSAQGAGVAWSGVCEALLGPSASSGDTRTVAEDLLSGAIRVADWQGTFAAVAWNAFAETVVMTTGATQSPSMWWSEGPDGWAAGNRALPILELVGRQPTIDLNEASLYLGYGYHAGDGSLLEGARRLRTKTRVTFPRNGSPVVGPYISMEEYLTRGYDAEIGFEEAVGRSAEVLAARAATQARASSQPTISLTGGRDSRTIAAALAHGGYRGAAFTGGEDDAKDVVLAARVAAALGFEHQHGSRSESYFDLLGQKFERARTWSLVSEGLESVRHSMHFRHFYEAGTPPAIDQQFIGVQPGLNRLRVANMPDDLTHRVVGRLLRPRYAIETVRGLQRRFEREAEAAGGAPWMWKELYALEVPGLRWAQDNVSAKDGLTWWWTPLMDSEIIRASWHLPRDRKFTNAFVEALTLELAPALRGIPYDRDPKPTARNWRVAAKAWARRASTRAGIWLPPSRNRPKHPFWDAFLFEREPRVWNRVIDDRYVRKVLAFSPRSRVLWSIATLELLAEGLENLPVPVSMEGAAAA